MGLARYCVCGWLPGVGEHDHDERMKVVQREAVNRLVEDSGFRARVEQAHASMAERFEIEDL